MVVDADLTRERDGTRKVVVATIAREKTIPTPWVLALITLVLAASARAGTAEAQEPTGQFTWPPSEPRIAWFSRRGLDVTHNKLDQAISSGVPCPQYRRLWPGECPPEFFLTRYLESLPPDLSVIADTLRSFGAVCRKTGQRLTCVYRKHQNYKEKLTSNRFNEEVHYYTAKINVANRNAKLAYWVSFDRKVTTLYRNRPAKREAALRGKFQPQSHAIYRKKD